jgi:hypothetical protein
VRFAVGLSLPGSEINVDFVEHSNRGGEIVATHPSCMGICYLKVGS